MDQEQGTQEASILDEKSKGEAAQKEGGMRKATTVFIFKCNSCGAEKVHGSCYPPRGWVKLKNVDAHHCPHCIRLAGKMPHNLTPEELRKSIMKFDVGGRRV